MAELADGLHGEQHGRWRRQPDIASEMIPATVDQQGSPNET
jgi:hypothetical protein